MKTRFAALVLLPFIALIGCSKAGTLTFTNNTGAPIWVKVGTDTTKIETAKSAIVDSEKLDYMIVYAEKKSVDYNVYGICKFSEDKSAQIVAGDDTAVTVTADAGAVGIRNNSSYAITGVYIVVSTTSGWGSNLLSSSTTFSTGKTYYWSVAPGFKYDAYIADGGGYANISGAVARPSSIPAGKVWAITNSTTTFNSPSTVSSYDATFEVVPNADAGPLIQKSMGAGGDLPSVR